MRKHLIVGGTCLAILIAFGAAVFGSSIRNLATYGWGEWPTHEPITSGCPWKKRTFTKAGITAFVGDCYDKRALDPLTGYAMIFSDESNELVGKWVTNATYEFTIQSFPKTSSEQPIDVVKTWYAKLTPDQQKVCQIQNADEPVDHFGDGTVHWTEKPHPMPHKIRYKIDINPELGQEIMQNSEPADPKYDYMCGHLVGTIFTGHPPYFEFDDRSPNKYLLVGAYGQEGPLIDLNSIQF